MHGNVTYVNKKGKIPRPRKSVSEVFFNSGPFDNLILVIMS